jgi:hypothetical protein
MYLLNEPGEAVGHEDVSVRGRRTHKIHAAVLSENGLEPHSKGVEFILCELLCSPQAVWTGPLERQRENAHNKIIYGLGDLKNNKI